jgi:hypothetical protein
MTPSTRNAQRPAALAAAVLAALLLSACASLPGADSGAPEEQVAKRCEQRWAALVKRDFAAAYAYNQPAYRDAITLDAYQNSFGAAAQWKTAKVIKVTCEADRCKVKTRLTVTNHIPLFANRIPEITSDIDEVWIRDQGQWWYYNPAY